MPDNLSRLRSGSMNQAPLSAAFGKCWAQWLAVWPGLAASSEGAEQVFAHAAAEASRLTRRLWHEAYAAVGDAPGGQAKDMVYAFVALLDETLLFSPWPGQTRWQEKPLEFRLFNSRAAGERVPLAIYKLLGASDPASRDLANVDLQCLNLGFQGRMRGTRGQALHEKWRHGLFAFAWQRDADMQRVGIMLEQPATAAPSRLPVRRMLPDGLRLSLFIGLGLVLIFGIGHLFWRDIAQRIEPVLYQAGTTQGQPL
jgi:type VI secretion system protein ImpK